MAQNPTSIDRMPEIEIVDGEALRKLFSALGSFAALGFGVQLKLRSPKDSMFRLTRDEPFQVQTEGQIGGNRHTSWRELNEFDCTNIEVLHGGESAGLSLRAFGQYPDGVNESIVVPVEGTVPNLVTGKKSN